MSRPQWVVQFIKQVFPGRFLVAKATRLPVFGTLIDRLLFDGDGIIYLPKDGLIQVDEPIELPGEMVLPSQVVDHFIQTANTRWLMNTCICRESSHCNDYPVDMGCLFLGDAAEGISPHLGRRVGVDEALEHMKRCREAGLVHMVGRNKIDTIWLGIGPGDRLLTICNCCPCCCLWRVLPHLNPSIGDKISRMPGVLVQVNGNCTGCGRCIQGVCFVDAVRLVNGSAIITDACRGCGRCVEACPQQAIGISVGHNEYVVESVARIAALVDVTRGPSSQGL